MTIGKKEKKKKQEGEKEFAAQLDIPVRQRAKYMTFWCN